MSSRAGSYDRQPDPAVEREKEAYGGIKIGSAFFGWLTATGTAVLLTAVVAGVGLAVGMATGTTLEQAASEATTDPGMSGLIGGAVLLVILFVAYFCGGYVAGRMARFDGAKQGLAVWLWAVVIAILATVLGMVAGERFNLLVSVNAFPRLPVSGNDLTTSSIVTAIAIAAASLLGAVLGGKTGMRFHRKVDEAGLR